MRRPRLFVILPKLSSVDCVYAYPFAGSHTLARVPPVPFGAEPGHAPVSLIGILGSPLTCRSREYVFRIRLMSLFAAFATSYLVGYAWLNTLKNPARNWSFFDSLKLKFLKNETSKLLRDVVRR